MAGVSRRIMQNRRGLINGGPGKSVKIDVNAVRRSIDRMTYLAFAAVGVVMGTLLALYLTGRIP